MTLSSNNVVFMKHYNIFIADGVNIIELTLMLPAGVDKSTRGGVTNEVNDNRNGSALLPATDSDTSRAAT